MTNVQRHAQASAVRVTATRHGHDILIEIADDGKGIGIRSTGPQHSWGLVGMQERIGHFGGSIDIVGRPDHGTLIAVHLPLSAQGAA